MEVVIAGSTAADGTGCKMMGRKRVSSLPPFYLDLVNMVTTTCF